MKRRVDQSEGKAVKEELTFTLDSVPADGALGLLAYGDLGLMAWRKKRAEVEGQNWRARLAEELQWEEGGLHREHTEGKTADAED